MVVDGGERGAIHLVDRRFHHFVERSIDLNNKGGVEGVHV